jgi:hypothetical protein
VNVFRYLGWISLCLVVLSSCSYTNNDDYLVEPVADAPARLNVQTSLDSLELPIVEDSLLVFYNVEVENGTLYYVEAIIDAFRIYELETDYNPDTLSGPYMLADSFWIRSSLPVEPGINTLLLSFYHSANTNSLGDILQLESRVVDLEFEVDMGGGIP